MRNKTQGAIKVAKKHLLNNPRDVAHGLDHHERVWKNCQQIIKKERLDVDTEVLIIATYWHDVVLTKPKSPSKRNLKEMCVHLTELLPSLGFSQQKTKSIILTVRHHEFGDKPATSEGFILQDADKMDVVSIERWLKSYRSYQKGALSTKKLKSYLATFLSWAPMLKSTLHYNFSKNYVSRALKELFVNDEIINMFRSFNLEQEFKRAKGVVIK